MSAVRLARIVNAPLSLDEHVAAVRDASVGAITTFIGQVRDHDPDASSAVVALEYTAHPDAEVVLADLAERAGRASGALVAVSHRVGTLSVGEPAVIIAVAASHRAEAFQACRALIEAIKTDLPVWKRQRATDGSAAWKGVGG